MLLRYYTIFREEFQHSSVDFIPKNVILLEKKQRFQTPSLCRVTNTFHKFFIADRQSFFRHKKEVETDLSKIISSCFIRQHRIG